MQSLTFKHRCTQTCRCDEKHPMAYMKVPRTRLGHQPQSEVTCTVIGAPLAPASWQDTRLTWLVISVFRSNPMRLKLVLCCCCHKAAEPIAHHSEHWSAAICILSNLYTVPVCTPLVHLAVQRKKKALKSTVLLCELHSNKAMLQLMPLSFK